MPAIRKDAAHGRADVAEKPHPRSVLPDASRKNVLQALNMVRTAPKNQTFSQGWLRKQGIGQGRQAMKFLRFLNFLNDHQRLNPDVVARRANLRSFRELVLEGLQSGCEAAGLDERVIEFLKQDGSSWLDFRQALIESPVLEGVPGNVLHNVLGCFKSLHEIVPHLGDEVWFEAELRSFEATTHRGSYQYNASGALQASEALSDEEVFRIPYAVIDGQMFSARVVFTRPARPEDLQTVGAQLQQLAIRPIPPESTK